MAISTYSDYFERMNQCRRINTYKSMPIGRNSYSSSWRVAGVAGAIPTTSEACYNTTIGAINYEDSVGQSTFNYVHARCSITGGLSSIGNIMLIDRLVHSGNLDGTVTSAQTTHLPTATLPRYTSGVGVMAAIEIYTTVGTTVTTVKCEYTNQAGTTGRISKETTIGSAFYNSAGRIIIFPLEDGDTGVRSVESVTVLSTTGTAGNFGVTLFKPLQIFHPTISGVEGYGINTFNSFLGGGSQFESIVPGACLSYFLFSAATLTAYIDSSFLEVS